MQHSEKSKIIDINDRWEPLLQIINNDKSVKQVLNSGRIYEADVQVASIGLDRRFSHEAIIQVLKVYTDRLEWEFGTTEQQVKTFFENVLRDARSKNAERELERSSKTGTSTERAISLLSEALQVGVNKLVHRGGRGGRYEIILDDGANVEVGSAEDLLSYRKVAAAFYDNGIAIPVIKNFKVVSDALLKIVEHVETFSGDEETILWLTDFIKGSESSYLKANLFESSDERDKALEGLANGNYNALKNIDGSFYLTIAKLLNFVRIVHHVPINLVSLGQKLSRLEFFKDRTSYRDEAGNTYQLRVWISPAGFDRNI
jgi:hypothetical protein